MGKRIIVREKGSNKQDKYIVEVGGAGTNTQLDIATSAEMATGTSTTLLATPKAVADSLEAMVGTSGLTTTYTELNKLDGAPLGATFVVGAEGSDTIKVTVQLTDGNGTDLAVRGTVLAYLSNDEYGNSVCTTAPAGGVAIATDGLLIPITPTLTNAVLLHGNLVVTTNTAKFKTAQVMVYTINGINYTKAATDDLVFTAAHVITASKFGIFQIQINAAGTISTKVPGATQAYNDAATALAALPAVDAGNVSIGYLAIENNAGDWTANTDDLVASGGADQTTAAFTDATELTLGSAKAFYLTSESDGDIDINIINATTTPTYYLALVMPTGKLVVSGAITFA